MLIQKVEFLVGVTAILVRKNEEKIHGYDKGTTISLHNKKDRIEDNGNHINIHLVPVHALPDNNISIYNIPKECVRISEYWYNPIPSCSG